MAGRRTLCGLVLVLAACTYGPEERSAEVIQIVRLADTDRAVAVVREGTFRRPTGLSTFPDGGKWKYTARGASEYLLDAGTGSVQRVARQQAPPEQWELFNVSIAGLAGDTAVYLRSSGCPEGGECHPALQRYALHRLSLRHGLSPVDSIPDGAGLPGVMVSRRPGETNYVRFSTTGDSVSVLLEEDGTPSVLFALDPNGSLQPVTP
ncbi:MAG: hypothetical protein HKN73_01480 [Gemmatimonadetes bacterium]|nr:hypothetical protein [Gemmatimonadota bacterium]